MISNNFSKKDAPLLIVFGQSNAHGHATKLTNAEIDRYPLENVFGLSRKYNQAYGLSEVKWEPFSSKGMNLGENQDDTCCLAGEFACLWQQAVLKENTLLPDLYIVQISIGCQGIDAKEKNGFNMWYKDRAKVMKPGSLEEVDISLYPLAVQILSLAVKSLKQAGKMPVLLGLHFNQWETEVDSAGEVLSRAKENYKQMFAGFYEALGVRCNTYLYFPHSEVYAKEAGRRYMAEVFEELEAEEENIHLVDVRHSYLWSPSQQNKGIFQKDLVHYTREVQKWFAKYQSVQTFGKKILVLGDSITADGRYLVIVENYLKKYRPYLSHEFKNYGLCSENITGLTEKIHPGERPCILNRIDTILDEYRPDMALICYGMNDGIYQPFSEEKFILFQKNMRLLSEYLEGTGIEICLMTPPPFEPEDFIGELKEEGAEDYSYLTPYCRYDDVLKIYSDWIREEWERKERCVIDLHTALKEENIRMRQADIHYQSGDGIHPGRHGHFIIAACILKRLYGVSLSAFERTDCIEELDEPFGSFTTKQFFFRGYEAIVAFPKQSSNPLPWVYRTEFFGEFPSVDLAMLKEGYAVAGLRISDMYGGIKAVRLMEEFCKYLTKEFGFALKTILFGFSRGGLYALHFAKAHPECVKGIYFDAPVVDIYSWPGKYEDGKSAEWRDCRKIWHLDIGEPAFLPIVLQALKVIMKHNIPVVLVYGEEDQLVPYSENGVIIERAYQNSGIPFLRIAKSGVGHHPHSLSDPKPIVDFFKQQI